MKTSSAPISSPISRIAFMPSSMLGYKKGPVLIFGGSLPTASMSLYTDDGLFFGSSEYERLTTMLGLPGSGLPRDS